MPDSPSALANLSLTERVVRTIAETCVENEQYFCDLDSVVGDGDFGYSLARGFEQVLADWASYDRTDSGAFLLKIAMAITSRIGGTSGPIWGTAFMRAGTRLKGLDPITGEDTVA
ncbi:MAG: DAK2 domain-containing protein, partial [Actinomycetales bacterium]|nr:DAK2 domain-containing protein [Actinomycetales bacterium]